MATVRGHVREGSPNPEVFTLTRDPPVRPCHAFRGHGPRVSATATARPACPRTLLRAGALFSEHEQGAGGGRRRVPNVS